VTTDGNQPSGHGFGSREPAPVGWPTPPASASHTSPGGPSPWGSRPASPGSAPGSAPAPAPTPGTAPAAAAPPPAAATRPTTASPVATVGAAAARKPGRRARLTVKRIDPWSTLKFSFVYSLAGLVVLLVAVVALYGIVDAMGVIDSIKSFLHDVEGKSSGGVTAWLTFGRVFSVALVVGLINVILFTAFATLTAFIYNVCTDLVGGIEVTLAERN
jgi:hypothetical protein